MDTRSAFQTDMPSFDLEENNSFTIGYYTQKSPESTTPNEDALGIITFESKSILMVADGVGGTPKGEEASETAIKTIINEAKKNLLPPLKKNQLRNTILNSIEKANDTLLKNNNGARTTLTVCEINKNILRNYQIGDSCLIVCGQKGLLKYKATEHSPVGYAVAAEMISQQEAIHHPERHYVSNVMGENSMSIEIGPPIELAPNDTILLASDGLFDNFLIDDLIEIIRKESMQEVLIKLTESCQRMREKDEKKNFLKADDISFVICRLNK